MAKRIDRSGRIVHVEPRLRQYDSRARRARARAQVAASPWCARCNATSDLTADHIVAIANGGDPDGPLQTLCRSCNSRKRQAELG